MKFFSILFAIALAAGVASAQSYQPKLVKSSFAQGYIPLGFDSNDQVQLVGEGILPNTCYKPAATTWTVRGDKIIVAPKALLYNGYCLEVLVPHNEVVDLGVLPAGNYTVVHEDSGQKLGELTVAAATTASADDFLYAPIGQAYFRKEGNRNLITLSGAFSNSCMQMTDIKLNVQEKVIVVQPIVKMTSATNCQGGNFPFQFSSEVKNARAGRYLLHVRALNGKAVNNLIDIN